MMTRSPDWIDEALRVTTQVQPADMPALPKPVVAFCRTGRRSAALYRMGKDQE